MERYCTNCGKPLKAVDRFCANCGKPCPISSRERAAPSCSAVRREGPSGLWKFLAGSALGVMVANLFGHASHDAQANAMAQASAADHHAQGGDADYDAYLEGYREGHQDALDDDFREPVDYGDEDDADAYAYDGGRDDDMDMDSDCDDDCDDGYGDGYDDFDDCDDYDEED